LSGGTINLIKASRLLHWLCHFLIIQSPTLNVPPLSLIWFPELSVLSTTHLLIFSTPTIILRSSGLNVFLSASQCPVHCPFFLCLFPYLFTSPGHILSNPSECFDLTPILKVKVFLPFATHNSQVLNDMYTRPNGYIIKPRSFICWFHDAQHLFSYGINDCFTSLVYFFSIVLFSKCNMI
jgi:hypothetical protein